jgi:myo-inositol catabolism protein IolC
MSRSITDRAAEISQIALDHGWDAPTWSNFLAKIMLVITEVQEAEDAAHDHDAQMLEWADVAIRALDILFTLDRTVRVRLAEKLPDDDNLLLRTRRLLCRSAEWYRRGEDDEALGDLCDMIAGIEQWCEARGHDLWGNVDKKIEINRARPRLHGKKRSVG